MPDAITAMHDSYSLICVSAAPSILEKARLNPLKFLCRCWVCSRGCKQMFVEKSHPVVNDAGSGAQMADYNWYPGGQSVSSASSTTA